MFPTHRYFQNISCPHADCSRVYCPFKHEKFLDNLEVISASSVIQAPSTEDFISAASSIATSSSCSDVKPILSQLQNAFFPSSSTINSVSSTPASRSDIKPKYDTLALSVATDLQNSLKHEPAKLPSPVIVSTSSVHQPDFNLDVKPIITLPRTKIEPEIFHRKLLKTECETRASSYFDTSSREEKKVKRQRLSSDEAPASAHFDNLSGEEKKKAKRQRLSSDEDKKTVASPAPVKLDSDVVNAKLIVAYIEIFEELPTKVVSNKTPQRPQPTSPISTVSDEMENARPPVKPSIPIPAPTRKPPSQPPTPIIAHNKLVLKKPPLPLASEVHQSLTISKAVVKAQERMLLRETVPSENDTSADAPNIPLKLSSTIPLQIRQNYLKQLWRECLKIYGSDVKAARERTLHEEQSCHDKSSQRSIYINAVVACIRRLRHEQTSGVSRKEDSTFGIYISPRVTEEELDAIVKGPQLYELLRIYLMTEQQLVENSFPRASKTKFGEAEIFIPKDIDAHLKNSASNRLHTCCRCGRSFSMNTDNLVLRECVYHWGKAFTRRIPGVGIEQRYTCCSADVVQTGCQVSPSHVFDTNKWLDVEGYQRTIPPPAADHDDYGVYSLDCEMVYTTAGFELARVTVVDRTGVVVYDTVVRPINRVLDYNTRFSGLSASMVESSTSNIVDVQEKLMNLFTERSILIGHSLENDMIALKLIHSNVIDTSLVFPHRLGPPKKRALKNIAADELNMIIQNNVGGHDSFEDALACMRVMQHKVKQDLKKKYRPS